MSTIASTISNYYKYLDLQKFENAFQFLYPSAYYTVDKFLLEKSVNEGGLIPSYSTLDTLQYQTISYSEHKASIQVNARWNTSLGKRFSSDTIELHFDGSSWKIVPKEIFAEINPNQIDNYNYVLFHKNGKRILSTFPTVFDDRIKKPFVQFRQVNLIYNEGLYIAGEIQNTDIFPVSLLTKAIVKLKNGKTIHFYTKMITHYNIAPKGHTFFRIDMDGFPLQFTLKDIVDIEMVLQSDVSDRGYIHGGPIEIVEEFKTKDHLFYTITFFNDKITDLTIPGILFAKKNDDGYIVDSGLFLFDRPIRSGLSRSFSVQIEDNANLAKVIKSVPFRYSINDKERNLQECLNSDTLDTKSSISFLSHSFIGKEIIIQ